MDASAQDELTAAVRADFDRLAALEANDWNHNAHYHRYLLRQLPAHVGTALDVGCGTGAFSRLLAARADRALGLDLSPEMIGQARARSAGFANVEFEVADVRLWSWPREAFDCIACIATLHHLPLAETLASMRNALRPGGVLLVLDLYRAETLADFAACGLAMPLGSALRLLKTGRLQDPPEVRQAWDAHGLHDHYPTLAELRLAADPLLPGVRVLRHLLYRYSLVWRRPL